MLCLRRSPAAHDRAPADEPSSCQASLDALPATVQKWWICALVRQLINELMSAPIRRFVGPTAELRPARWRTLSSRLPRRSAAMARRSVGKPDERRRRGAALALPVTAPSARGATRVDCGQHAPYTGGDVAMRAGSGKRPAVSRPPGRCAGRVSRGGPRSRPFYGLDGVEDTRTRHDLPPPLSPAPRPRRVGAGVRARARPPQARSTDGAGSTFFSDPEPSAPAPDTNAAGGCVSYPVVGYTRGAGRGQVSGHLLERALDDVDHAAEAARGDHFEGHLRGRIPSAAVSLSRAQLA
jgi:hypothetical protein